MPPGASKGAASASSLGSGATARAVISGAGLALIRLDKVEGHARGESQDQPRKPSAGAKIYGTFGLWCHERSQLQRIGNMSDPEEWLVCPSHQVHRGVPAQQQRGEAIQLGQRFT